MKEIGFHNPYLVAWEEAQKPTDDKFGIRRFLLRDKIMREYSFAIPTREAIEAIVKLGPIVEMGAGIGYWAYLIQQMGGEVVAYDKYPLASKQNPYWLDMPIHEWHPVLEGTPEILRNHSDKTLLLVWPDHKTSFASQCLYNFGGQYVAYIGEGYGGCTGDDKFHQILISEWDLVQEIIIPRWSSNRDCMMIYKRKG